MVISAELVTRRLRAMAEASRTDPSPMVRGVDMAPAAVTARLHELADVSRLCATLAELGAQPRGGSGA
jgi:hypothetical protein